MNFWKISTFVLLLAVAILGGTAVADRPGPQAQPLMRSALASLRDARDALSKATHDKGGHRLKALELTNAAIDEVQKGIGFDNKHR